MFYTLSTKIPNIMTGKKLLKIFALGSIGYVVSNYFLQINKSSEKLKLFNKYFYYVNNQVSNNQVTMLIAQIVQMKTLHHQYH